MAKIFDLRKIASGAWQVGEKAKATAGTSTGLPAAAGIGGSIDAGSIDRLNGGKEWSGW